MRHSVLIRGLVIVVAAGLVVDAVVHAQVASSYALVRTSVMSQADLFRLEALLAVVAAAGVFVRPTRVTALAALVVSVGGVGAVLLYTYVDPGVMGPVPDMFDPVWYPEKVASLVGESVAALAGVALVIVLRSTAPPAPLRSAPGVRRRRLAGGRPGRR